MSILGVDEHMDSNCKDIGPELQSAEIADCSCYNSGSFSCTMQKYGLVLQLKSIHVLSYGVYQFPAPWIDIESPMVHLKHVEKLNLLQMQS